MIDPEPLRGTVDLDAAEVAHIQPQRLYQLWEEGHWLATAIDFTQDAIDWQQRLTEEQRNALLWQGTMFLHGEKNVNVALAPFIAAVPCAEHKLFLSTQLADEARHHMFFDRFLREVCGVGRDMASTLERTQPDLPKSYIHLFQELDRITAQLNRHPQDISLLAQGITLYHLVLEGFLGSVGLYYLRDYTIRQQLLPGLAQGLQKIIRDESRHVAFGIQMLRELLETKAQCKTAVLDMLDRVLPLTGIGYMPGGKGWSYFTCLGYSPQVYFATSLRFLETRLERAGIQPSEVLALVKLGYPNHTVKQSRRLVYYLQSGVLNADVELQVTEETVAAMFEAIQSLATWGWQHQRNVNLKLQWIFPDAQPYYLLFNSHDMPQLQVGQLPQADLTFSCSAADWARIVGEHLSVLRALLSRRLRITGNLLLAPRLLELFPMRSKRSLWLRFLLKARHGLEWIRRRPGRNRAPSLGKERIRCE